ncbi:CoA pyrophosphatase [Nakamurella sp. A5-74]|uniref:CoA pyrophosphatase n=1 Tax=Nakamurella sp. A5-74 TaxID=3158264 RepID=A0AAU8DSG9_9ACTN
MTAQQVMAGERLPGAERAPVWLTPLIDEVTSRPLPGWLGRHPVSATGRQSAVLILLGAGSVQGAGPDLLLLRRAGTLRNHAGQPAFPGGRQEPGETDVETALREAQEETGLDPAGVTPVALLRQLSLDFSGHLVRPVLGYWSTPSPVRAVDQGETAAVHRIPIAALADPANRGRVRLSSGFAGPAFAVSGMVVWGFTGLLVDAVLELGGWARPWGPGPDLALPADDAGRSLHAGPVGTDDPRVDGRTPDQVPR